MNSGSSPATEFRKQGLPLRFLNESKIAEVPDQGSFSDKHTFGNPCTSSMPPTPPSSVNNPINNRHGINIQAANAFARCSTAGCAHGPLMRASPCALP